MAAKRLPTVRPLCETMLIKQENPAHIVRFELNRFYPRDSTAFAKNADKSRQEHFESRENCLECRDPKA